MKTIEKHTLVRGNDKISCQIWQAKVGNHEPYLDLRLLAEVHHEHAGAADAAPRRARAAPRPGGRAAGGPGRPRRGAALS